KNLNVKVQNEKMHLEKCKVDALVSTFEFKVNTRGKELDKLYQDYLNYKEDLNETNQPNQPNTNSNSIRFVF
ncbi:MAG: hypothetical protein J7L15_03235, partial [Clostridiales bacterium]|nr:hypothetical protein [Clostridiales bacterium]